MQSSVWINTLSSVLAISCVSFVGALILPAYVETKQTRKQARKRKGKAKKADGSKSDKDDSDPPDSSAEHEPEPPSKSRVISFLVSLAIGAMLGDAFLHMLPEIFGAHRAHGSAHAASGGAAAAHDHEHAHGAHDHEHGEGHDHGHHARHAHAHAHQRELHAAAHAHAEAAGGEGHSHEHSTEASLLLLLGMLLFFLFEKALRGHHHHHAVAAAKHKPDQAKGGRAGGEEHSHGAGCEEGREEGAIEPSGYLNLVADGLHNFFDGLAIATANAAAGAGGRPAVATTVAIFLHELPQELGDLGVLIDAGFSKRRALLLNFASALVAVLGALVGLVAGGAIDGFARAMRPVTCGGFIYVAAANMIPELHSNSKHGTASTALQLAGMASGVALTYLVTFAE